MKFLKKIKESRLNLILLLLYPIVTFYLLEWFTHNPWKTMKATPQVLNIVMFELVALLLFALFGRLHAALMTETLFFFLYGLVNYFVLNFRSVPIQPWDLFSISTAASVADNYEYTLDKQAVLVILGFLILLALEFFCRYSLKKGTWKFRIPTAAVVCALLVAFGGMFHSDEIVQQKLRLYDKLFTPTTISFKNGTALAFVMELRYISVDKPAGYNADAAREELAAYAQPSEAPERKPNIIVIMDEAFSDPAVLADFQTNEDYMPFMHSMMAGADNTVSGWLNVSVLGGNTANTEFEYLTGNTMAFLPTGSIPYQQYIKAETPSMASHLASLGYKTVAMHPYKATGWDRDKVYPDLGFQEMHFLPDYKNPLLVREYVSDKSDFEKIIETYEKKEPGEPLFVFNVTMQNHSSYTESFDNFQPTNSVVEPVWKLNGKRNATLTEEELSRRYKVPFIIWANYDIEETTGVETSANYLGFQTLQAAGLPLPDYFSYLAAFSGEAPVISANHVELKDGTFTNADDQKDLLSGYRGYQYYQIFDASKRNGG